MTRKKQTISIVVLSKTTYKVVGMMTDTAYSHLQIGDITVDYTTQRIQGQDNPTAGGANPVIDMKCPNAGACFKVNVKKTVICMWLSSPLQTSNNLYLKAL